MTLSEFVNLTKFEKANYIESHQVKRAHSRRAVYGVGINDAHFNLSVKIEGRTFYHPAFTTWSNMLKRCYYAKNTTKYNPAIVCDEWHKFSNFYAWWKANYIQDFEIDKDFLSLRLYGLEKKVYSPETCQYVPKWLNLVLRRKSDGKLVEIKQAS